jgi:protocatechuate 3,4-dioxygenase, beta subunit
MNTFDISRGRRRALKTVAGAVVAIAVPALASSRRALPSITDGPFYPSLAYRARSLDWDADLTTVRGRAADGQTPPRASGEHLDLYGVVSDANGRIVDAAEVEIWQCDAFASYRHPKGAGSQVDEGFQGFGSSTTDARGAYRFRTIRPVPYPGRTPHIHVKLRHPSFGELTSQLFVAGEAGNGRDFLYRGLSDDERQSVQMQLRRAPADAGVVWLVEQPLVVGV